MGTGSRLASRAANGATRMAGSASNPHCLNATSSLPRSSSSSNTRGPGGGEEERASRKRQGVASWRSARGSKNPQAALKGWTR